MKILIEIPTWLGDAVMATPAIRNIINHFPNSEIILFGSYVSIEALKSFPEVSHVRVDDSKKGFNRYIALYKIAKEFGRVEYFFSFRRSTSSKIFRLLVNAKKKFQYKRLTKDEVHQSIRYNDFVNHSLKTDYETGKLELHTVKKDMKRKVLGLNPGATYGSAKRWYPSEFAKVAKYFSDSFDIIIFGGPNEVEMAAEVEALLEKEGINNYTNYAGKTSIEELISLVASLDLFITNDSGPMHVAAAFEIPTVAIFGPTRFVETSAWMNPNYAIARVDIECAPCMKRVCPLGHHECMKRVDAQMVIELAKTIIKKSVGDM